MNEAKTQILLIAGQETSALLKGLISAIPQVVLTAHEAHSMEEVRSRLSKSSTDLLIIDQPAISRKFDEFLKMDFNFLSEVPFVITGDTEDDQASLQLIRKGAQDYLVKKYLNPIMLMRVIRYSIERKRIRDEIRETQQRYEELVNGAPDPIMTVDKAGIVQSANLKTYEITGYTEKDLLHRHFSTLGMLTPSSLVTALREFSLLLLEQARPALEYEIILKNGEIRCFEGNPKLIRSHGKITGAIVIFRDMTERRKMESKFRTISKAVEQSPSIVMITSVSGIIEYVNPAFTRITGYDAHEAVGKNPRILKSGRRTREDYETMWKTILGGKDWHGVFENRKKNSEFYWASASISPVKNDKGEITHFLAIQEDITDKKKVELALEHSKNELLQAQKLEGIGQLAGGVAHDFNNLLTVIIGYSSFLQQSPGVPEGSSIRKYVEEILKAGKRAELLTRQLLLFSRKQIQNLQILELDAVVLEMMKMVGRLLGEGVELSTLFAAEGICVKADVSSIQQVVMNLAVNARDAMEGQGKLIIETRGIEITPGMAAKYPDAKPGRYVLLAVSDSGCGMSEEIKAKIFEPFFTTKPVGKGTGLGLSTVYGIVKQMNGIISVDSEPGSGTTFRVYFPVAAGSPQVIFAKEEIRTIPGGTETILLAEDDPLVRHFCVEIMKSQGYQVLEALNGEEALRIFQSGEGEKINLLVTDLVMPRMGGLELIEKIRKLKSNIKVLMTSGYTQDFDSSSLETGHAQAFLQKPFSRADFLSAIRTLLDEKP